MTKIKLCGMKKEEHILWANEAGPEYIGFVFAPSRRQISFAKAAQLKRILNPSVQAVGVFVDADIDDIVFLAENKTIDCIQLHGTEDADYIHSLKQKCKLPIIKAIGNPTEQSLKEAEQLEVEYLLLDASKGGSGKTFDWAIAKTCKKPFFLAGGLNPQNLQEAIETAHPYAVDLSSGLEIAGEKQRSLMLESVSIAHNAG